jgi:hypothetical protein
MTANFQFNPNDKYIPNCGESKADARNGGGGV